MIALSLEKKIIRVMDIILGITCIIVFVSLITITGFYLSQEWLRFFYFLADISIYIFILYEISRTVLSQDRIGHIRERWFESLIVVFAFIQILFPEQSIKLYSFVLPYFASSTLTLVNIAFIEFSLIFVVLIKALRYNHLISKIKLHPGAIISVSFFSVILGGALLLMLPRATDSNIGISFVDALFTSTSAVCVTGLTAVDTAKVFTPLGKLIIISLIQIGGLGVMTLTTFFAFLLAGGLSIKARVIMRELLSHENIDEVKSLLMKILLYTVVVESIGAVILYCNTSSSFSELDHRAFYYAVFHAVSAFCNAGFSLYTENLMHKEVLNNYVYLSTIMLLIVIGGIGFLTQSNIIQFFKSKRKNRKLLLTVNTKIILITTFCLIVFGTCLLYFVEPFSFNPHLSGFERWMHSMFLSITARTAGYNSVPTELLSNTSVMILIMLMWIGASPGSTGGGIKTTTFALVVKTLLSVIQGKERVEIFKREIPADNLKQAFLVFICSILVLGVSGILLVYIEPNKEPLSLIFEATSAIGTVGLSRNLTFFLGDGAKVILTLLMFIGRVGVLTFFLSLYKPKSEPRYRLPLETIMVG